MGTTIRNGVIMGIDVYVEWDKRTEEETQKQYTGFSIESGDVGYLREAYHGSPYATHYFVQEAFEDDKYDGVAIPSDTLLERVPLAVDIHIQRHKEIYKEDVKREDKSARAFGEFAKLVQDLEKQGKNPKIRASY
jgi:hypothetical protein|tara:strand:- start:2040 stop:2444 length:405 start_codon:yes stop_codon:yes gene_type:complete